MISTFESAIRLMPSAPGADGRPVESWVWVMDFHGFSIRDCDPRLAKVRGVMAARFCVCGDGVWFCFCLLLAKVGADGGAAGREGARLAATRVSTCPCLTQPALRPGRDSGPPARGSVRTCQPTPA
jgi:hypothetical protein